MVSVPGQYQGKVKWAAQQLGLPVAVVAAQINEESGFNPGALSPTGAQGIAQFEPGTWSSLGCAGSPDNPDSAFTCYVTYMHQLLAGQHGNVRNALAAYNAGPGDLAAGYGYADTILNNAGQNPGLQAGSGGFTGGGGTGTGAAVLDAAQVSQNCLWGVSLPGGSTGGWIQGAIAAAGGGGAFGLASPASGKSSGICVLSRSGARAILGGALIAAGSVVILPGVILLAAFSFKAAGGPQKVMAAASFVPGVGTGVKVASAAGAAASRAPAQGRHAKTGAGAPAQGRHAAPAGP